jgi:hypothetical protein
MKKIQADHLPAVKSANRLLTVLSVSPAIPKRKSAPTVRTAEVTAETAVTQIPEATEAETETAVTQIPEVPLPANRTATMTR